jgi:hypothetical protein
VNPTVAYASALGQCTAKPLLVGTPTNAIERLFAVAQQEARKLTTLTGGEVQEIDGGCDEEQLFGGDTVFSNSSKSWIARFGVDGFSRHAPQLPLTPNVLATILTDIGFRGTVPT